MQEIVQAAAEDEFSAGVGHDLAYPLAILGGVTVVGAVLAGWLGLHRAVATLDEGMHEQTRAFQAEAHGMPGDCGNIMRVHRDQRTRRYSMIALAIDLNKADENLEVLSELLIIWPSKHTDIMH